MSPIPFVCSRQKQVLPVGNGLGESLSVPGHHVKTKFLVSQNFSIEECSFRGHC